MDNPEPSLVGDTMQCPKCKSSKLYNLLYGLIVSEWRCLNCNSRFEYIHYKEGATTNCTSEANADGSARHLESTLNDDIV